MWKIPLFKMDLGREELEAVQAPIQEGWLTMGPATQQLESNFAALVKSRHAIAVSNGTSALHLALLASGLCTGDEVIVPALTFVASANAARYCGARVVFADIGGEHDLNVDPDDVRKKITDKTRAIVAVHYAGFPAHIETLCEIAETHGLFVIEDSAHALVTELGGRFLGTFGTCGCFSFFSNKNMTCGEGGMIVTDDEEIAAQLRLLRSHGMTTLSLDRHKGRAWSYDCLATGWNVRIDDVRASLAVVQLKRLPDFLARREQVRREYLDNLRSVPVTVPFQDWDERQGNDVRIGYHIMPIVLPRGCDREAVMEALKRDGIQSSIHYPPAHRFSVVTSEHHPSLPHTEDIAARELTLPFYPGMSRGDVADVCTSLARALTL